ncbi:hypothetical protein [Aquisalimonas sp.]|uniref:hypothetical protein n=1 Tax=unclassified Aquisalimonas TaxID=2644645 RepID=UPI0025C5C551|nr:hypothetical protein [Aquisalimonas sp.]
MPIDYRKTVARLEGTCTVEEAEELLQWLQANPQGKVNLKECGHLHAAVLQVLMAVRPPLSAEPSDPFLARWVTPAITGT